MADMVRTDTANALERYEVNTFGSVKKIVALDEKIPEDQEVIFIAPTNVTVTPRNTTQSQVLPGVMAITSKQIFVSHKTGMTEGFAEFNIIDLERVHYTATGIGPTAFELTLLDVTLKFISSYKKSVTADLYNVLKELAEKAAEDRKQAATAGTAVSPADEIRKFKGLLDDGIITQEEFDAKKKQLLGL